MMLKLHPTIRDFIAVLLYNPSTKALKAMPDTMTIMYELYPSFWSDA